MRRAVLVFNPRAGRRRGERRLERIRSALAAAYELRAEPTSGPEHARAVARGAVADRLDAVFALGGDGTLRVLSGVLAGTDVALGPLPGGTTNVVARSLGLPVDPVLAAASLIDAVPRAMDVGRVADDRFLMQVSGGLDALVISRVDPRWKRRLGRLAVALAGIREWRRYRFPDFELEIDGAPARATGFVVSNLAEYAGSFRIVPEARADDRRLEILLFRGRRRRDALGFAIDLARGRHARRPDVEIRPLRTLRVLGPGPGLVLQADGDPYPATVPLELGLCRERLLVLAPTASPHPSERRSRRAGEIA